MKNATPIRSYAWRTVAASLAMLLALLVTPLCTGVCAGRMCALAAPAGASERHCHATGSMHDCVLQVRAAPNCNSPEIGVANLSFGNGSDSQKTLRAVRQSASYLFVALDFGSNAIAFLKHLSSSPGPQRPPYTSSATSVLRI